MVNLRWSQLAFLSFHHCSRDQASVSTCGLDGKLLPLHWLQKSEGGWGQDCAPEAGSASMVLSGISGGLCLRLTLPVCYKFSHQVLGNDISVY